MALPQKWGGAFLAWIYPCVATFGIKSFRVWAGRPTSKIG